MAAEPTDEELVREACRSYDIRIPGAHREQSLDALLRERQHAATNRNRHGARLRSMSKKAIKKSERNTPVKKSLRIRKEKVSRANEREQRDPRG